MGTPEFPDLGKHCAVSDCKLIDFLPFTCDRCNQHVIIGGEIIFRLLPAKPSQFVCIADDRDLSMWCFEPPALEDAAAPQIVYCLEHRSYIKHQCTKADKLDVTVVICPLCAKGVRLVPDQDPNITWENHVNTDCDPSNYEKATKKKKCPALRCKEILVFSNTIKCKDCLVDHCLKHRFGPDHNCPGPKKSETSFSFMSLLNKSKKEESKPNSKPTSSSSSKWTTSFLNAASNFRASAEAGMSKLGGDINQAWQTARDGVVGQSSGSGQVEQCPQCGAKFSSVTTLVDHVQKVHERSGNRAGVKVTIDVCPKCSKGFRDPVSLVEHVERDHGGTSRA